MYREMSSIFDAYNEEFNQLAGDISNNISQLSTYESDAGKIEQGFKHVDALFIQARDLLKQMAIEVRSYDNANTRREMTNKVTQFKDTLKSLKNDYQNAKNKAERNGLFGSGDLESDGVNNERSRFLNANDKLLKQNDRIREGVRTIQDTEMVALEITGELDRNREKILSAHDKVRTVSGMADDARKLIHRMSKREVKHKLILLFVGVILIGAIGFVIYYSNK